MVDRWGREGGRTVRSDSIRFDERILSAFTPFRALYRRMHDTQWQRSTTSPFLATLVDREVLLSQHYAFVRSFVPKRGFIASIRYHISLSLLFATISDNIFFDYPTLVNVFMDWIGLDWSNPLYYDAITF
uniref:Uncharacterized protein n=1 Tax=Caenorhabditis japonica TaxID=281687 RepID=A0A8R1IUN3_CAEJA